MPVLPRLTEIYAREGYAIISGLNPSHYDAFRLAPFTWIVRDGKLASSGLGIALQEVYFFECLMAALDPAPIYVIGNSMGFSTLAVALAAPASRVVAIDTGWDAQSLEGLDLTRRIVAREELNVAVLQGASPDDVARTAADGAGGVPFGCVFIDGYHSNEQVVKDFAAVRAVSAPDAVYVFHDVRDGGLEPGLNVIARNTPGFSYKVLEGTPSGIAVGSIGPLAPAVAAVVAAFSVPEDARPVLDDALDLWRNRRSVTLRRSVVKRLNALRKVVGLSALPLPRKLLDT